jgi:hypothetical protein
MKTFCIDVMPHAFDAIWRGAKKYEIQKERGFEVDDVLDLRECQASDPLDLKIEGRTGRAMRVMITYKTPGGNFGMPMDVCVLGFAEIERAQELFDGAPAVNAAADVPAPDVEIIKCRCGGSLRFSGRGESVGDSLRFAMHTKPVCEPFEELIGQLLAEFTTTCEIPVDRLSLDERMSVLGNVLRNTPSFQAYLRDKFRVSPQRIDDWEDFAKKTMLQLFDANRQLAVQWPLVDLPAFPRNMPSVVCWNSKYYRLTVIGVGAIACCEIEGGSINLLEHERKSCWTVAVTGRQK